MSELAASRRPVKSRSMQAFHRLAFRLVEAGLTPNQVSVLSAVFATLGGASLLAAARWEGVAAQLLGLAGALLGIQLRLVCNLLDGLMAVEGGKKTPYGELFNDFPDRISDIALLLAAGYALASQDAPGYPLTTAWVAALAAVLTAYVRVLGASMGAPHFFLGPMAKQHRMAALNVALVGSGAEALTMGQFSFSLTAALYLIAFGSVVTCFRRLRAVLRHFGG